MKLAIYGGTVEPMHHGHLIIAREALETLGPDEVIFVPARVSPFKKTTPVASGEIRLSMLRAAIENEIGFAVDDCELRRPPPSYTIDTVKEIRRRKNNAEIYCLIGEDNVDELTKWHRFAELEQMVRFIVLDRNVQRPSRSYQVIRRKIEISATEIRKRVTARRTTP